MFKVLLIGNLTKDPEMRSVDTANGVRTVTNFTVACNGRRDNDTTFVRISVWDTLAENCAKYLAKGRKVWCVCNNMSARTYQVQDGTSRISLEATANEVEFLSSSREQGAESTTTASQYSAPSAPKPPQQQEMTPVDFSEDELPF